MPVYNTLHFSFFAALPTNFDEADAYLSNFLIVTTLLLGISVSLLTSFDHDELGMMDKLHQNADLCMDGVGNCDIRLCTIPRAFLWLYVPPPQCPHLLEC